MEARETVVFGRRIMKETKYVVGEN